MSILPFIISQSTDLRGLNDGVLNECSGWRSDAPQHRACVWFVTMQVIRKRTAYTDDAFFACCYCPTY